MSATLSPTTPPPESTAQSAVETVRAEYAASPRVRPFERELAGLSEADREAWSAAARDGADLRQTPEYAAMHLARPDVPRLPGLWISPNEACGRRAVLLPKRLNLPKPLSWVRRELRGYWMAGNGAVAGAGAGPSTGDDLGELLAECGRAVRRQGGDFLLIEDLELDTPLKDAAYGLLREGWRAHSTTGWQPRWRIRFPETADEYWAKFNSKRRGNLRRQQRQFGGTVVRVETVEQVDWFLEKAAEVSKTTWQTRVLGQRVSGDEFERRCHELAARTGSLRSYVLMKDDKPASFAIGLQYGGRFSLEEIGYDPIHAEWSPGMVLLCHILDDLYAERTPAEFDFGGGDAPYKRTLANHESVGGTVWLIAPGWSRRVTLGALGGGVKIRAWGRRMAKEWAARRTGGRTEVVSKGGTESRREEG
jgi:hypothetical protein